MNGPVTVCFVGCAAGFSHPGMPLAHGAGGDMGAAAPPPPQPPPKEKPKKRRKKKKADDSDGAQSQPLPPSMPSQTMLSTLVFVTITLHTHLTVLPHCTPISLSCWCS